MSDELPQKQPKQRFRFRWRARGKDHEMIIEASSYPMACYELAGVHHDHFFRSGMAPSDFELDLSKPEIVP